MSTQRGLLWRAVGGPRSAGDEGWSFGVVVSDQKGDGSAGAPWDAPDVGRRLDLRGLRCPLPVLKIRKALSVAQPGALLTALCDDPLAALDVPNFVRETGDELISAERGTFVIRKAADSPA